MFSPLLLPPHRSARAERPEAGGRSGEEAPGSPRRGRLGPPPRSAPLCSWQPGSHSASESQRRRAPAPPANQRAGGARRRAANRRGFKGARAAEGSGREAGGALAPVGLRARALRQVWRRPSVGDLLRSPSARRPFPLSHLRVPSLGTCLRGSGPPSESRSPLSVCEIVGFFQLSPILSLLSANCCLGWENLSRCRLWWLGVQTGEPLDAPLRHM